MEQSATVVREAKTLLSIAASRTFSAFAGSLTKGLRSFVILAVGAFVHYRVRISGGAQDPSGDVMAEVALWAYYVAVPAAIIGGAVFLWNLWLAPYRLMQEEIAELKEKVPAQISEASKAAEERCEKIEGRLSNLGQELSSVKEIASALVCKELAAVVQNDMDEIDRTCAQIDEAIKAMLDAGCDPDRFKPMVDRRDPMRYPKEALDVVMQDITLSHGTKMPTVTPDAFNPYKETPGDDKIITDEFRHEYRAERHRALEHKRRLTKLREAKKVEWNNWMGEYHTVIGTG